MADISTSSWSETDASNTTATPDGWPEGQAPSTVNDCARAMMGALKRLFSREHATTATTVGGTANAITLAHAVAPAAYTQGDVYEFKAASANTGATTLNVDGLGAKNVFKRKASGAAVALTGGEIQAGDVVRVSYDGTQFQLLNQTPLRSVITLGTAVALSPSTTTFTGPGGAVSSEGNALFPVPFAGTVRNLFVNMSTQPGAGQSYVFTVRKNVADTAVTATISGAAASTANDQTHSFAVAAGDLLSVKVVTSGTAASAFCMFALEIDSP